MVTVPLTADTVMQKDPFTGAMWLLRMTGVIPSGLGGGRLVAAAVGWADADYGRAADDVSAGLFLCSRWEIGVGDPELTLQLLLAGAGFGLVIAPILHRALTALNEAAAPRHCDPGLEPGEESHYRATAASLVTVSRMMGMTLGLAAMSAWGVEHFQVLTSGLELPLPQTGESAEALNARVEQYTEDVNAAGLSVFRAFFRTAAVTALAAIPFVALWGRGKTAD